MLKREKSHKKRLKAHSGHHGRDIERWARFMKPAVNLKFTDTVRCDEKRSLRAARIALSYFNKQVPHVKYELVRALGCIDTMSPSTFLPACMHCNFIARPKNKSKGAPVTEENNKLFFGEVECSGRSSRCSFCCILGQTGTVTGNCGCRLFCRDYPELIQHPKGGGFRMTYKRD
ncbi:unnamed protein product [Cuscuta epithymum]|uniref:DUF3615 domain-containing protein n=1 Tax=Cuscuta epithymum TaxID=186058 RepID=A0AAV0CA36_9ASTE|nr:unnamed protein product [Cuscuta epithymum]